METMMDEQKNPQVYIGDSVYMSYDGFSFIIYTNNGLGPENVIYLEPEVVSSMLQFIKNQGGTNAT
jgi:hypothetical protein